MKDLNIDIIAIVLKYTNINEVVKTCLHLNRNLVQSELDWLISTRKDIRNVFKGPFEDTVGILQMIHKSGSFLSGMRVIDYFKPITLTEDEPWIFYCQNHPFSYLRMLVYLESMDIKFESKINTDIFNMSIVPMNNIAGYKRHKDKLYNIYVCWSMDTIRCTEYAFPKVNKVSTPSYNGIFGNVALLAHAEDLFKGRGYVSIDTARQSLNAQKTKYDYLKHTDIVDRCMKYIPIEYDKIGIRLLGRNRQLPFEVLDDFYSSKRYIIRFEQYNTSSQLSQASNEFSITTINLKNMPQSMLEKKLCSIIKEFMKNNNIVNYSTALLPYAVLVYKSYGISIPTCLHSSWWKQIIKQVIADAPIFISV